MRPFKISGQYLAELTHRLSQVTPGTRGPIDLTILGFPDDMNGGQCVHCQEDMAVGYLLPGYGYVCHICGIVLVVRSLIDRIIEDNKPTREEHTSWLLATLALQEPRPNPSPGMISIDLPPVMSEIVELKELSGVFPSSETVEIPSPTIPAPSLACEASEEIPEKLVGPVDWGAPPLNVHRVEGAATMVPPVPAAPPLVLNEMKSFRDVPAGTVMRIPISARPGQRGIPDPENRPSTAISRRPNFEPGPGWPTSKTASDMNASTEPAIVIDNPEVDLSTLPPDLQPLFEGYRPGRVYIQSASDVYAYENQFADPTIVAMLTQEDDEELLEGEQELERAKEVRRQMHGGSIQISRADGVATVRTFDPVLREQRLSGPDPGFEPLKPID